MAKKPTRKQRRDQKARADRAEEHGLPSRRPEPVPESRQRAVLQAAGRAPEDADDEESFEASDELGGVPAKKRGGSIWERWQRLPAPVKWGLPVLIASGLGYLILRPPNAPRVNTPSTAAPPLSASTAPSAP